MKRWLALFAMLMLAQPLYADAPTKIKTHILTAKHKKIDLTLEVAATRKDREHGLMNRKTLKPYDGMAFFFRGSAIQKFWMKDTLIPLDILFVDEDGTIVYIVTAKPLSEEPVGPDSPVLTVIELNGGRAAKSGIAVGDKVVYDYDARPSALAH